MATKIQAETRLLVGEFQLVHEKAGHFAERVASRGVDIRADLDIRSFVERAVLALETAAYETADLTVAPQRFFQQIDRANRLIALALSLSQSSRRTLQGSRPSRRLLLRTARFRAGRTPYRQRSRSP